MESEKSKVYALLNGDGYVTRIDGGYSESNIKDFSEWVCIDAGYGDKYNLCQSNYLPKPITDERGIFRYKIVDGMLIERTADEMNADYIEQTPQPTQLDRIEAQALYTAIMTETLLSEE